MRLDVLINENYSNLNDNDLHILKYIKNNPEICGNLSIADLASQCSVSTTSILRTARKLNFSGYSEFKYFLRRENGTQPQRQNKDPIEILNHDTAQTIKGFQQNQSRELLYQKMEQAGHLYAYGTGYGQRLMINEFSRCLLNMNKNLIILPATTEFKIAKKNFKESDLLFIVSLSGNIKSYKETILNLGIESIPIVSITNLENNDLASLSQYNFYFQCSDIDGEQKLNQSSFLTLHLILHLIYSGYVEYLKNKKFQSHHQEFQT